MSRRPAALARGRARSIGLLLATAVLLPLAAGCGAGQVAATALDVAAVEGVSAYRGGLAVLNVRIVTPPLGSYASGGTASLYAVITTDNLTTDTLVGIRTDAADGVTLVHVLGGSAGTPTAAPSGSPSASGPLNIMLDHGVLLAYQDGSDFLQLQGLKRSLIAGVTVSMTFTFADAGDITLEVPVATPDTPQPRLSPSPALSE